MTSQITEQACLVVPIATHAKPAGLNTPRASAVLGPDNQGTSLDLTAIKAFLNEFGGPEAFGKAWAVFVTEELPKSVLHEAAGLGPLTGEFIYDQATGTFKQIDGSDVSNISNQAPHIAGPNQVPPAPG